MWVTYVTPHCQLIVFHCLTLGEAHSENDQITGLPVLGFCFYSIQNMATGNVVQRLMREAKQFRDTPNRDFVAYPLEENILEWHFTMRGPPDSPYCDGFYHGKIIVPPTYPFAPPDVMLLTPNGRFELHKIICLSVSSYHPELWRSTWGLSVVLHALRQFMPTPGNNGIAAIEYPEEMRRKLAGESLAFRCPTCQHCAAEDKARMDTYPEPTSPPMIPALPPTTPSPAAVPGGSLTPPPAAGQGTTTAAAAIPGTPLMLPAPSDPPPTPPPPPTATADDGSAAAAGNGVPAMDPLPAPLRNTPPAATTPETPPAVAIVANSEAAAPPVARAAAAAEAQPVAVDPPPAPAAAAAPPVAAPVAAPPLAAPRPVQRQGLRLAGHGVLELRLSLDVVDRFIVGFLTVLVVILLKKLILDVPRPHTPAHRWAVDVVNWFWFQIVQATTIGYAADEDGLLFDAAP
mgnify:FL=1